jgi:hypothetical protein
LKPGSAVAIAASDYFIRILVDKDVALLLELACRLSMPTRNHTVTVIYLRFALVKKNSFNGCCSILEKSAEIGPKR